MNPNSFYAKAAGRMGALANWPNAEVPVHALVTEAIPEMCKVPYDYLFRDSARAMVECTMLMQEYFDVDLVYANTDVYNFEGEAMGAEVKFFKDHCPNFQKSNRFIKCEEDLEKIKFTGLDMGRFPYILEYCKAFKDYTGVDTFPELSSPWTLAANLYGLDNLVADCYEDPEFVTKFLNKLVDDFFAPMYQAFAKTVPGFGMVLMGDAFASIPIVSMDIVNKFIKPMLERLKEKIGIPNLVMIDTAFFGVAKLPPKLREEYIDFIIWANGQYIALDDDLTDIGYEETRRIVTEKGVMLTAGLEATFLERAPLEDVIARTKDIILTCKQGPTPMAFLLTCINPGVPHEKVKSVIHAARVYGAPGATADTPLEIPAIETFEEFLKRKLANNVEGYTFEWMKHSGYSYLLDEKA